AKTGMCVLDFDGPRLVWSDSILLSHRDPGKKLLKLRQLLLDLFERFSPNEMAIEDVFLPAQTSPRTPISLGELRGVARMCAAEARIPVFFYPPARIKLAITGSGRARKEDVVRMVESEFRVFLKDHNQADAISVAYTHWFNRRFEERMRISEPSENLAGQSNM
ncbi:crossover junction endodeoxyribonuclease RuvC, partial [bacterium]|nr:crossover junction endodeoxyribonuclease RuvC [bacterium]